MFSKEALNAIKIRYNNASAGPWGAKDKQVLFTFGDPVFIPGKYTSLDDAVFVAAARTDVPKLVAEVERLQADMETAVSAAVKEKDKEIEGLKAQIVNLKDHCDEKLAEAKEEIHDLRQALERVHSWVSPGAKKFIKDILSGETKMRTMLQVREMRDFISKTVG